MVGWIRIRIQVGKTDKKNIKVKNIFVLRDSWMDLFWKKINYYSTVNFTIFVYQISGSGNGSESGLKPLRITDTFFLRDCGPTILNFVPHIGRYHSEIVFFSYLIVRFALGILGIWKCVHLYETLYVHIRICIVSCYVIPIIQLNSIRNTDLYYVVTGKDEFFCTTCLQTRAKRKRISYLWQVRFLFARFRKALTKIQHRPLMSYVAEFTASWQILWKALVIDQISIDTNP